ncbi:MAG TPA: hypothetical protein DCG37_00940 [Lachnospiraceae bacterium]|nr:hypothetical protein [Lachnospiraceae bacterium]
MEYVILREGMKIVWQQNIITYKVERFGTCNVRFHFCIRYGIISLQNYKRYYVKDFAKTIPEVAT